MTGDVFGDMFGDFSRMTFAPDKHFSAVLIQQGRVMLDADANEQTAILLHYLRTFATDLIGPHAGPERDAGFKITVDRPPKQPKVNIGAGRYYVNGMLCIAERATSYYDQPDAFLDEELDSDVLPDPPYILYLRVWERQISEIEDPTIRERALGDNGPDTARRSKIIWQVLTTDRLPLNAPDKFPSKFDANAARKAWDDWETQRSQTPRPMMKARGRQPAVDELDPCITSPEARYRGAENQLYRVEIHRGGSADVATFKWSRDNGSAVYAIESLAGTEVTVTSLGRDQSLGLNIGDWVEVVDDRSTLRGEVHPLVRVKHVDPLDRVVLLESVPTGSVGTLRHLHPFLRRWDQQEGPASKGYPALDPSDNALRIVESSTPMTGWLELEDGVQVQFQGGGHYSHGDYWLIPARVADGDIEWPRNGTGPAAQPPAGVRYSYAPLALVTKTLQHDLRRVFESISRHTRQRVRVAHP